VFKNGLAFNKEKYFGMTFNGYRWAGRYADGTHMFVKEEKLTYPPYRKYYEMRCTEDQLSNGDAEFMSLHKMTYAGSAR